MTDADPLATQRDLVPDIPANLCGVGFDDVEEVGRGGFGVVYRCAEPMLDHVVAVKVLGTDLDEENLERFLREQRYNLMHHMERCCARRVCSAECRPR